MTTKGDKSGGDKITVGNISGTGIAVGREAQAHVTTGVSAAELNQLFALLMSAVQNAPAEKRDEAIHTAEALKNEVAKGKAANDSRMAKLLDRLVELVPEAISTVASMFASPILGGLVGPATKFVLEKIQDK